MVKNIAGGEREKNCVHRYVSPIQQPVLPFQQFHFLLYYCSKKYWGHDNTVVSVQDWRTLTQLLSKLSQLALGRFSREVTHITISYPSTSPSWLAAFAELERGRHRHGLAQRRGKPGSHFGTFPEVGGESPIEEVHRSRRGTGTEASSDWWRGRRHSEGAEIVRMKKAHIHQTTLLLVKTWYFFKRQADWQNGEYETRKKNRGQIKETFRPGASSVVESFTKDSPNHWFYHCQTN